MSAPPLEILDIGVGSRQVAYDEGWQLQRRIHEEVVRGVRPDTVLLLEHVRPRLALLGWLFDRLNPLVRRTLGPNINRRTEDNVEAAGLRTLDVRRFGIWREIVARPASSRAPSEDSGGL